MDNNKLLLIFTFLSLSQASSVSYLNVSAVIGHNAEIPCELTPHTKTDNAYLVLWWFKNIFGTPIYSFDMRNNTKHWMASVLGEQTSFYVNRTGRFTQSGVEIVESYLQIKRVQWKDEGFYRCRVDFFQAPTRNLKVKLSLIELPEVPKVTDRQGMTISSSTPTFHLGFNLSLMCTVSGGNPRPTLDWWTRDEDGEKLLLHSDPANKAEKVQKSFLDFGPLQRKHHGTSLTCEALNNDKVAPLATSLTIQMILPPTRIQLKRHESFFVSEKLENITCSTFGSNPQAYTRIWHNGKELPIVESKAISNLETVVTAKFLPLAEDDGTFLTCRAENPLIASSAVEDQWKIDVHYAPKCSYKGPQRIYGAIGEKILLVCDVAPFPSDQNLQFQWQFRGHQQPRGNPSKIEFLRTHVVDQLIDKFHFPINDQKDFGKVVCTAQSLMGKFEDDNLKGTEKPCIFEIVPKDLPYLEACNVLKLNEKWITVECVLDEEAQDPLAQNLEFWVTILNSDGEKFMQSFSEPLFNVTHFANAGLLWIQVRAKGQNGYSNTIHIEINFKKEEEEDGNVAGISGQEMTISMLPILCLLAGSLAVLLSIVAGVLECSRRKYSVSNEVTHISFSNNLDLNPSGISSFKTESYEQLNDVRFEGFKLHNSPPPQPMVSSELVQIHSNAKDML